VAAPARAEGTRLTLRPGVVGFGTVDAVRLADRPLIPDGLRRPAAVVAVLAATVVAVLGARYAGDSRPGRVDGNLDDAVDALPDPGHGLARAVTLLGTPAVVAVVAVVLALVCLLARRPRAAVLAVAGPGLTGLITTLGKPVVDRTIGDGLAFPSGHTGGATSLALVIALLVAGLLRLGTRDTAVLAVTCAVAGGGAVGTGMVIIGAHYPTDVVGGFCAAVAAVLGVALVLDLAVRMTAGRKRTPAPT
jgi:membrane-associated phospholipid phosphatase